MEFKDYGFKPVDVIKGLNLYYSRKDPKYLHIKKEEHSYWHLLDRDVTEAINWLREEYSIFYTPGMKIEDVSRPDDTNDIFDTPRYKFLSILSAELGFRTIVGPGNADKTEYAIMRAVKCRNDELKNFRERRTGVLDEWRRRAVTAESELDDIYKFLGMNRVDNDPDDVLDELDDLKDHRDASISIQYVKTSIDNLCRQYNVVLYDQAVGVDHVDPCVQDYLKYIFDVIGTIRKERDEAKQSRAKFKGMLNTWYGASCGENVLPCYRDACNNPKAIKVREAANYALFELRAKIREVYRGVFSCGMEENYSYTSALNDILEELKFQKKLKETAEEKTVEYKTELNKCREYILTAYREIFDCSNGDPEGTDKENLEDILEEYRRVTKCFEEKFAECDNLKRRLHAERSMCDHLRKENSHQCSYREEFLRKLCKEFGLTVEKCPNYLPAMENAILNSVKTLSESFDGANGELEEMTVELNELRKSYDNLSELYSCAVKHLGEHLKEVKDILGIDSCDKDTVASAIKALKSAYEKLQKDYDELGKAYSSVLKWNNSYADVRRLLEVHADADAGAMVNALNKLKYDCETCDRIRKKWHERYTSEHTRANGEHKRAEKCFGEIAALKTQVASLERSLASASNEQVGIDAFRNEIRKLEAEKSKVIEALGQDIWDDCVK